MILLFFLLALKNKIIHTELIIKEKMGFSEVRILRKNYIASVPDLTIACVFPGGFFSQIPHTLLRNRIRING